MTLVKRLACVKETFTAIVQMYFQSLFEWFICFKTYDTHYLTFWSNIKLEQLQITVWEYSHDVSKSVYMFKKHFPCYFSNIILKFFRMA